MSGLRYVTGHVGSGPDREQRRIRARGFAAQVSHARRPDFLPFDRREQLNVRQGQAGQAQFG